MVRRCFTKGENKEIQKARGMRKIYKVMMKTLPILILSCLPTQRYGHLQNL